MEGKKIFSFFALFALAVFCFAGGVENKTNMTPGYSRNPSRNVESERPEAAFYNIAGTAFMADGLWLDIGNQFVIKKYSNDWDGVPAVGVNGGETSDTTPVLLYPDVDIVFKHKMFSVFGDFGVYAGGGHLEYEDGTCATSAAFAGGAAQFLQASAQYQAAGDLATAQAMGLSAQALLSAANSHSLDVTSITYGGQIGASFKPCSFVSVAAALRFVYGTQEMQLKSNGFSALPLGNKSGKIKYNAKAFAFSPVIGAHFRPFEFLDIAVQYQGCSYLNYEVEDLSGNEYAANLFGIKDGKKFRTDIPMALNVGAGFRPIKQIQVSASFSYYFNKIAAQNSVLDETDYDDSWELAVGADWRIIKNVSVSLGLAYAKQGSDDDVNSAFNPVLDSLAVGLGVEWNPIERLTLTLSGMFVNYFEKDYYIADTYKTELNKKVGMICIGVTYRFL